MVRRKFHTLVVPDMISPHIKPEHIKMNEDYEAMTLDQLVERRKRLRWASQTIVWEEKKITRIITERVK